MFVDQAILSVRCLDLRKSCPTELLVFGQVFISYHSPSPMMENGIKAESALAFQCD